MLLRAFYVLLLLHPYADRSTSIGEAALQGRECQSICRLALVLFLYLYFWG